MQLRPMIAGLLTILSVQSAYAGCANFEDGSMQMEAPKFEICYNGVCDIAALSYECGNVYSFGVKYDVGWSKTCELDEAGEATCTIYWQGRPIDQSKYENLTCTPLSPDGVCNFP